MSYHVHGFRPPDSLAAMTAFGRNEFGDEV
jgi:hypothetical protein